MIRDRLALAPLLVSGVLLLVGCPAKAQPSPGSPHSSANAQSAEPLLVSATGDQFNRAGGPIFVNFAVKNISTEQLVLKNLSLEIDSSWKERFHDRTVCALRPGEIHLAPGLSFQQRCRFDMTSGTPIAGLEWAPVSLLAVDVPFVVQANVEALGRYEYYPTVNVKPPELSIFIGGVVGALGLAIFMWIERLLSSAQVREKWGRELGAALLLGLRGGIMAMIALLLGKSTQGAGAPVNLNVSDFAGGVLIGLFSYPLAAWISSTLRASPALAKEDRKESEAPATPTAKPVS